MKHRHSKWKLALKTLPFVAVVLVAKLIVQHYDVEVLSLSALFTAIISANIFLIGFLISGTLVDYKESEKRIRIGDWEGDTVIGEKAKNGLLTHVDRKSGFLLADKITSWKAEHIRERTVSRFGGIPKDKRKTCTYDNGVEFSEHEFIERFTQMTIYFAYPYHSWERGTNENTNGLLRQFFPKKFSLKHITQEDIEKIVKLINNRPRKRLDYLSPSEVFNCDSD